MRKNFKSSFAVILAPLNLRGSLIKEQKTSSRDGKFCSSSRGRTTIILIGILQLFVYIIFWLYCFAQRGRWILLFWRVSSWQANKSSKVPRRQHNWENNCSQLLPKWLLTSCSIVLPHRTNSFYLERFHDWVRAVSGRGAGQYIFSLVRCKVEFDSF